MTDLIAKRLAVSEEQYHADPCDEPSLSSSIAKVIVQQSSLHAWQQHPRFGSVPRPHSKVFDHGHLMHKLVLGKGADIVSIDAKDYKTKAAQEARDEARKAGKIPALGQDLYDAEMAAHEIVVRLKAIRSPFGDGIALTGESEVPIIWQELSNRGPIWCRCKLDHLIVRGTHAVIYDFKSAVSAHPGAAARAVISYGYDIQQAAYTRAVWALMPHLKTVDYVLLFGEKKPPHAILPAIIDDVLTMRGRDLWTDAVVEWGECMFLRSLDPQREWPGYTDEIVTLEAPGWMINAPEIGFEGEGTHE